MEGAGKQTFDWLQQNMNVLGKKNDIINKFKIECGA